MKHRSILVESMFVVAVVALPPVIGNVPAAAQQIPTAVVTDPPMDKKFPPGIVGITVPSHGVEMDATFYLAGGAGPHGTVLLLHGMPGYEHNGDLAQSIRRAGWNVLLFHYRGTWGTGGAFSLSSAIEDTGEAVRFLRDPATISTRSEPAGSGWPQLRRFPCRIRGQP